MTFVRLPTVPLVPDTAVERLREKFVKAKAEADRDGFWLAIQASKQPKARPIDFEDLPA